MQAAITQAQKGAKAYAQTAIQTDQQIIAFTLPSTPLAPRTARFHIRAALGFRGLDAYADDAEAIAAELVANAVEHAQTQLLSVMVMRLADSGAISIIVTDSCPRPPVKVYPQGDTEHGRGLHIVEALSDRWGWQPADPGKAVYAILTRET